MKTPMDKTRKIGNIKPEHDNQTKVVPLDPAEWQFDDETIAALSELGDIFQRIRTRMHAEGYTIVDGQVKKLETIEF